MEPSEAGVELLRQHIELRGLIGRALELADGGREDLAVAVARLAETFRNHARREEEVLARVLPAREGWGAARADIVLEGHAKEHGEIHAAFGAVIDAPDARAALVELVDQILGHMAEEERTFLAEAVQNDAA